ncbi:hypothetical protein [Massilia sp. CCM 8734]|uniref:hypothetical protein n=1 Tax=Massilia sp. CCM 8734 TaxID=2609283 RepID=UPI001424580C|nr:hypothetical protein [Massilia sp. CCM 8734]NHZ94412.1 hypothetical protein [Massilia sp. CCM 8734]
MAKSNLTRHADGAAVSVLFLLSLLFLGMIVGEVALIALYLLWPTGLIAAALVWYLTLSGMPLPSKILRLCLYLLFCVLTVLTILFTPTKEGNITLKAAAFPVLGMLIFAARFPAPKK